MTKKAFAVFALLFLLHLAPASFAAPTHRTYDEITVATVVDRVETLVSRIVLKVARRFGRIRPTEDLSLPPRP